MNKEQDQDNARRARAREVGLFRYGLISEALDEQLSTKQRGRLVRAAAATAHPGPFGTPVQVSRATLDRWIRDYRAGGFAALVPAPRQQPGQPGEHRPMRPGHLRPRDLTTQHGNLVTQHQNLGVLRAIRPPIRISHSNTRTINT